MNTLPVPRGRDELIATFGDCTAPTFEQSSIVVFNLPFPLIYPGQLISQSDDIIVRRSRCHKLLVPVFIAVLTELQEYANLLRGELEYISYGGIYVKRPMRGQSYFPSTHSWGIAIDIEPIQFPLGSSKSMPQPVVGLFEKHGFISGQKFKSRRDPQHFQYVSHY